MTSNRQSGQGCRSFGLGNQHSTIRIIRRHAALLEIRIEDRSCRPRSGMPAVPWRIRGFPQIQQIICYSKPLKYHTEMA
jgi:hypothetical protein